jgi:hypothetical protein
MRWQRRVAQKVRLEVLEINNLRPDLPQKMGLLATEVGISCDFAMKDEILWVPHYFGYFIPFYASLK